MIYPLFDYIFLHVLRYTRGTFVLLMIIINLMRKLTCSDTMKLTGICIVILLIYMMVLVRCRSVSNESGNGWGTIRKFFLNNI
jgi:hypothetical protein